MQRDHPKQRFFTGGFQSQVQRLGGILPPSLVGDDIRVLNYDAAMDAIDWEAMNMRDYSNHDSKCVRMAECIAPGPVAPSLFQSIYVKDGVSVAYVQGLLAGTGLSPLVDASRAMFSK
jgi:ssDNA thymidine ADP-ribosyltransferase, DarT